MEWLTGLTQWLWDTIKCFYLSLYEALKDVFIVIVQSVLDAIAGLISGIPVPPFLTQYSIGSLISSIPPDILYFLSFLHFPEGFAMISAAYIYKRVVKFAWFRW